MLRLRVAAHARSEAADASMTAATTAHEERAKAATAMVEARQRKAAQLCHAAAPRRRART